MKLSFPGKRAHVHDDDDDDERDSCLFESPPSVVRDEYTVVL